jgi:hypothetical protein
MASSSRRWIIFAPVALLALWSTVAEADALGDWTFSQSQNCGGSIEVIDNTIILYGPDNGTQEFGMCGGQPHWVKIETTIPEDVFSVSFDWSYQTRDGWVYDPPQYGINGVYTLLTQQNNASGSLTVPVNVGDIFTFRQYSTDTCCQAGNLTIGNLSLWESTTTSTALTTTTSTIVPETTVLATNPTTTIVLETTSTSSTSTTTSTTSTSTTTTTSSTTTTSTTTTTTIELVQVPTPVTQPEIVQPEPVDTSVPVEPEETVPDTTEPPVEETMPEVTLPEETTTTSEPSPETYPETTTTLSFIDTEPLDEEEVQTLVAEATTVEELQSALEELTSEQVEQVLDEILGQDEPPTQEQAVALATSPEVLAVVSVDEAEKIFETLNVDELTVEQVSELIEAVQSAPEEVREQFETTINIFGSDLGDYVPIGSNVPVDTRRTLIAVAAGAAVATVGSRRNN